VILNDISCSAPLRAKHQNFKHRFPPLLDAYDPELRDMLMPYGKPGQTARKAEVHEDAECRMLRMPEQTVEECRRYLFL
jgi:hypothetical protein